jgi:NADH:ubiquinone oxidoreductase subunit 6 (subunit J)
VTWVAFWILGLVAAASGLLVFRFGSMARATIALLFSFLATGGLLVLLGLAYLGVVVILMMIMEMVIMAVFMIGFMSDPAALMPMEMSRNRRGSLAVSIAVLALLAAGCFVVRWPRRAGPPPRDATFQLGVALMGPQMLTMVTLGLGLLATLAGAVVLATGRGRYDRFGDDLRRRPPTDPVRGGVGR